MPENKFTFLLYLSFASPHVRQHTALSHNLQVWWVDYFISHKNGNWGNNNTLLVYCHLAPDLVLIENDYLDKHIDIHRNL